MKIGVKYCGGCNPYYDRIGAVKMLERAIEPERLRSYKKEEAWDVILIVSGCAAACVDIAEGVAVKLTISSQEDIDEAIETIKGML